MIKLLIRLGRAFVIVLPSVVLAVILAFGVEFALNMPVSTVGLMSVALVPVLIGMPVIFFIEGQNNKLKKAVMKLDILRKDVEDRSKLDTMTGLYNHTHFMERIAEDTPSNDGSLIILDIDQFKDINTSFGYVQGDEALIQVVEAVRKAVRSQDVVGRIGGEEFAVFLQDASKDEAKVVASRIRKFVEKIEFAPEKGVKAPLTVSIGVAMKNEVDNVVGAMKLADLRMYKAKESGCNKVVDSGHEAEVVNMLTGA